MTVIINGTTGITNDGGYTGDGISFADTTPANTLVTTSGGNVGIGTSSPAQKLDVSGSGNIYAAIMSSNSNAGVLLQNASATYYLLVGGSTLSIYDNAAAATRLSIDSSGRVTTPYQPSFFVSNIVTVTGPNYIIYDQVLLNVGSNYNTSNGRFTAPVAGVYEFYMESIGQTANSTTRIYFYKNGGVITYGSINNKHMRLPGSNGDYQYGSSIIRLQLAVNDYIQVYILNGSSYGDTSGYNSFSGRLIG